MTPCTLALQGVFRKLMFLWDSLTNLVEFPPGPLTAGLPFVFFLTRELALRQGITRLPLIGDLA